MTGSISKLNFFSLVYSGFVEVRQSSSLIDRSLKLNPTHDLSAIQYWPQSNQDSALFLAIILLKKRPIHETKHYFSTFTYKYTNSQGVSKFLDYYILKSWPWINHCAFLIFFEPAALSPKRVLLILPWYLHTGVREYSEVHANSSSTTLWLESRRSRLLYPCANLNREWSGIYWACVSVA